MERVNLKNLNLKNNKMLLGQVIVLVCLIILMIFIFIQHQKKIEKSVLEKKTDEIIKLTSGIKRELHLELEYSIHTLNGIKENIDTKNLFSKENVKYIHSVVNKWNFLVIGIMDLNGNVVDNNGVRHEIDVEAIFKNLEKSGRYISDVIIDGDKKINQLRVAVPLYNNNKIVGILLGRYPISIIADRTELSETSHQYFQIVDTNGKYITKSKNKNVLTEKGPLWEELKKYKFHTDINVNQLKENVKNRKSGIFYFTYRGNGRYVSYSPLDINNWYIFAVLTDKKLFEDINEIRTFSNELLFYFLSSMIGLIVIIITISYNIVTIFKKQKQELEIKNRLFKMLMHKMNNIVFEIDFKEKKLIFFTHSNKEYHYDFKFLEPENLLKLNYIRKNSIQKYREIYKRLLSQQEIEDYILEIRKNFNWEWVKVHSIIINSNYTIGTLEDYTEEKKKEFEIRKINKKIRYDYLTKLYTKETCEIKIKRALLNYNFNSGISALFIIDLDNFKKANDTFGHLTGDKILSESATAIKNSISETDIAGRIGGDEFLILLENIPTIEVVEKIAKRLNHSLKRTYSRDGKSVVISASIGVAIVKENIKFKELCEKADKALYYVKTNGRNSYCIDLIKS